MKATLINLYLLLLSLALPSMLTSKLNAQGAPNAFLLYKETDAYENLTPGDKSVFFQAKNRFQADLDAFNRQEKDDLEIQWGWREYMDELLDMPVSSSAAHDRMRFEQAAELSDKNKALYNLYMQYLGALEGVGGTIERERGETITT